jgi:hypothetical protein
LGKNQGRFGEFFRYLWLSSFQKGKFTKWAKGSKIMADFAELGY